MPDEIKWLNISANVLSHHHWPHVWTAALAVIRNWGPRHPVYPGGSAVSSLSWLISLESLNSQFFFAHSNYDKNRLKGEGEREKKVKVSRFRKENKRDQYANSKCMNTRVIKMSKMQQESPTNVVSWVDGGGVRSEGVVGKTSVLTVLKAPCLKLKKQRMLC